jgi:predicted alpha-1,2-mannosidase
MGRHAISALFATAVLLPFGPAAFADPASPPVSDPASLVRPLAGTAAGGGAYPGATTPFGMIQYSPNTDAPEGGGYEYNAPRTWGFGLTHLSGPGCAAMGDVVSLPLIGDVSNVDASAHTTSFSHSSEQAGPGSYAVTLDASQVRAELTATTRTGWARYTFPSATKADVLIDPGGGFRGVSASDVQVVGDRTIEGSVSTYGYFNTCPSKSSNRYTVYFSMTFDRPFAAFGTGGGTAVTGQRSASGTGAGAWVQFDTTGAPAVVSKTGISYVSVDGARANLAAEGGSGFDFDGVRTRAHDQWRDLLGRVEISGGTAEQQATFYTSLYHTLLDPNVFSDVDGHYPGFDDQVHQVAPGTAHYTAFSMWDTYRTQQQVLDLVAPERVPDMAHSLLDDARQGGWIPKWPYAKYYTNEMVGDPGANVLTDAYLKGLLAPADARPVYDALMHNATDLPDPAVTPFEGRTGLADYLNSGYVPLGSPGDYPSAASIVMEYGVNDCALSLYADRLGEQADARRMLDRSQRFLESIDPQTGFVRPRNANGSWLTPFDPTRETGFKEGSAWHYTWLAPQDVSGLAAKLGGAPSTVDKMDTFFAYDQVLADPQGTARTVWGSEDHYNPDNETDLQAPYLYTFLGHPERTQDVVRAAETLFSTAPDGIPGNDDLGAMSGWYVLSALGLYPATAGADNYTLTSPLFPHAVVHLQQPFYRSDSLTIDAPDTSTSNRYVSSASLNGQPLRTPVLNHRDIVDGAHLRFTLVDRPGSWGSGPATPTSPCAAAPDTADVRMTLAPSSMASAGQTQPVTVELRNTGAAAATQLSLTAQMPDGWSVSGPPSTTLPPGRSTSLRLEVTSPDGTRPGSYPFRVQATWGSTGGRGAALQTPATGQLQVAATSLDQLFNTVGTSPDSNRSVGSLDGGGASLSRDALAAAGLTPGATVSVGGVPVSWPTSAAGQPDDVLAAGQALLTSVPPGAHTLAFLGTASSGPATGTGTLTYTDGTGEAFPLRWDDWTLHHDADVPPAGEQVLARMTYRNLRSGPQVTSTYVFGVTVALDPTKQLQAITLPSGYSGRLNIFGLGIG